MIIRKLSTKRSWGLVNDRFEINDPLILKQEDDDMVDIIKLYDCIKSNKWKVVCLTVVVDAVWLVWYFWLAIYVVYAVRKGPDDKGAWEPVYRSMYFDRAKEKYMYMNSHKEESVKHYILVNKEEGNSLIPFWRMKKKVIKK